MRQVVLQTILLSITFFVITFSFYFLSKDIGIVSNLIIIYIFLVLSLWIYHKYKEERLIRKIENSLPQFLKNIVNEIESGIPVPLALRDACFKNYGDVTNFYHEIGRRMKFLPFEKAVEKFERKFSKSKKVRMTINILKELIKSGYGIASSLNALHDNFVLLSEVDKERKTSLKQYLILIYAITFIFLGIVILIIKILVPILTQGFQGQQIFRNPCETASMLEREICNYYYGITSIFKKQFKPIEGYYFGLFFHIAFMQAFFAGLLVGMVVERSMLAGLRHSVILSFSVVATFGILTKLAIL